MSATSGFSGQRLRDFRHRRGLSVAELARAIEKTESAIYRLEAEERAHPRADTIEALARALGVSADELLGIDHRERGEVPVGELVNIPFAAGTPDAGEMVLVPEIALPSDVDHNQLVAAHVPDDACRPDLSSDDLAIIATDWPWTDGDLLAVLDSSGALIIRRAYHEGDGALLIGATPADRQVVPPQRIIGRVVRSIRTH